MNSIRAFKLFCFLISVTISLSFAQSSPKIRAAYINPFCNDSIIPSAFLDRVKAAGYTHVIVEIYPTVLAASGEWDNDHYNKGVCNGGLLYKRIKNYFQDINSRGMRMIPCVQVGTPDASWKLNHTNSNLDTYPVINSGGPNNTYVPSIAPGNTYFKSCFTEVMKVIQYALIDAKLSYNDLDFILLGYSEAFAYTSSYPVPVAYGTSSEDKQWLSKNPGEGKSGLVIKSIQEKVSLIHNIDTEGPLAKTRVIVYGDLFETECHSSNGNCRYEILPDVPEKALHAGLQNDLVFMQWWYQPNTACGNNYNVSTAFRCFTSKGFKIMYMSSLKWCGQPDSQADEGLKQMKATVITSKSNEFRANVIGGAVAGWCGPGYGDGTEISWTAIEWLKKLNDGGN